MSAQPERWPRPHRLTVVDLLDRRVVRHRRPSRVGYAPCDAVSSGSLPLPALHAEISVTELF